ncbi:MAG: hypothetical protein WCA39_13840 [Nitrososphaeraceae archaeon]|jgi:hypothetical protein
MKSKDGPSEWSDCARYLKEIAELKKAFIEADYESVRQRMQYEDELSKLDEECSYAYRLLDDAKAEIERLKAEHSSGNQSKKRVLEQVGHPESNTNLRAPYSPTSVVEENDY